MKFKIPIIACIISNLPCLFAMLGNQKYYQYSVDLPIAVALLVFIISFLHYIVIWIWKVRKHKEVNCRLAVLGVFVMFLAQMPTIWAILLVIVRSGI